MTSENLSSPGADTPSESQKPKESAYLRSNMTIKARRTPPTFLTFALLFISMFIAFSVVSYILSTGRPPSTPSLVGLLVPLSLLYLTYNFVKGWIGNTHTIRIEDRSISLISLRGKITIEFESLVRSCILLSSGKLLALYLTPATLKADKKGRQLGFVANLRCDTPADRGLIVQLVNTLQSRGVKLEFFAGLNFEFVTRFNTVVPEWQQRLLNALGEERHRFKRLGKITVKDDSMRFVVGSKELGVVCDRGVLVAYPYSEVSSLEVEFVQRKQLSLAKLTVVLPNKAGWSEEVEIADEVGKSLLLEASAAVKAMNTRDADPSPEDSPQKDNPERDNPERDNPERDEPKSEAGAKEGTGIQGDIK